MSQPDKTVYSASCNPPRRAKRPRINSNEADPTYTPPSSQSRSIGASSATSLPGATAIQPRPILPRRAPLSTSKPSVQDNNSSSSSDSTVDVVHDEPSPVPPKPPSRRGRKPGPLSRSAREAQRRLNHSIIEKARRTKINNALATLKELVPLDYAKKSKSQVQEDNSDDEEGEGDEDDEDVEYAGGGGEKKKQKKDSGGSGTGKKQEKEREYKLEILVRTVAYMQDLLQRVAILEQTTNSVCSKCGDGLDNALHIVHETPDTVTPHTNPTSPLEPEDPRRSKRARTDQYDSRVPSATEVAQHQPQHPITPLNTPPEPTPSSSSSSSSSSSEPLLPRNRLPSISSWLPETLLDPSIFNVSHSHSPTSRPGVNPTAVPPRSTNGITTVTDSVPPLQLPTPPSSTHFQPAIAFATSATTSNATFSGSSSVSTQQQQQQQQKVLTSPMLTRTPEDEHAATMLLQISNRANGSSPQFRPLPPSIVPPTEPIPSTGIPPSSSSSLTTYSTTTPADYVGRGRTLQRRAGSSNSVRQSVGIAVQTPASLLGLITPPTN